MEGAASVFTNMKYTTESSTVAASEIAHMNFLCFIVALMTIPGEQNRETSQTDDRIYFLFAPETFFAVCLRAVAFGADLPVASAGTGLSAPFPDDV